MIGFQNRASKFIPLTNEKSETEGNNFKFNLRAC